MTTITKLISPVANSQLFDSDGNVLSGGTITVYLTNSLTLAPIYANANGYALTNPVILDAGGRITNGSLFLDVGQTYDIIIRKSDGTVLDTYQGISGVLNATAVIGGAQVTRVFTATANQTDFVITDTITDISQLTVVVNGLTLTQTIEYGLILPSTIRLVNQSTAGDEVVIKISRAVGTEIPAVYQRNKIYDSWTTTNGVLNYSLTKTLISINNAIVTLDGIVLRPIVDYTWNDVSPLVLTLVNNPGSGRELGCQYNDLLGIVAVDSTDTIEYTTTGQNLTTYLNEVDSKLSESISVKDFGAVGDGVTDDTTAIQNAINSTYTTVSSLTGGEILVPTDSYKTSSTININNTAPFGVDGITLSGTGRQSSQVLTTGTNGIKAFTPIYFNMNNIEIRGASSHGVVFDSAGGTSAGNRNSLYGVRSSYNGGSGFSYERSYVVTNINSDAESNTGNGFYINTGVHTSYSHLGCYARNNTLDGHSSDYANYSTWLACASDGNRNGYSMRNARGVSVVSSGSEFNNQNGWLFETYTGTSENWASTYNCMAIDNNKSNLSNANHTRVTAQNSIINNVVVHQPVSLQSTVAGTFDFISDGIGAKLAIYDPLYYNSGMKSLNSGYIQVNYSAPKLVYNKLFAQTVTDTVCTISGSMGSADYHGEVMVVVQNVAFGSTSAMKSAVYKLLISQTSAGSQVTELASLGVLTTAAADDPKFTWSLVSGTLRATKNSVSTAAFWISVEKVSGNIQVI